jgi:16S rRNA (uracil1498-N3)-methyltransferase
MHHVPHVYVPRPWPDGTVPLDAAASHHLERVLRLRPGAELSYTDGAGVLGRGSFSTLGIERGEEHFLEPPRHRLTIAAAPPRRTDRQRYLVEKLAEIGVDRLVWLRTRYGEGRPPRPEKERAWAAAALQQSRGVRMVEFGGIVSLADLTGPVWVAEVGGTAGLPVSDVTICIGPEAGFGPDEVPAGTPRMGLGRRVLRVETASLVAAALALSHFGRFES